MRVMLVLLLLSANLFADESGETLEVAEMIVIDKMSATHDKVTLEVDKPSRYGGLALDLKGCWVDNSHYKKSFKALVTVTEEDGRVNKTWLFSEHPITGIKNYNYEMILQHCDELGSSRGGHRPTW